MAEGAFEVGHGGRILLTRVENDKKIKIENVEKASVGELQNRCQDR